MPLIRPESDESSRVDSALSGWRQGDFVIAELDFTALHHPVETLLETHLESLDPSATEPVILATIHPGAVVISQTCDVVRKCAERNRHFVQIAALEHVSNEKLAEIEGGYRPNYAFVPGAKSLGLVANLDMVTMVEKPLVAIWDRKPGCLTDQDSRRFSEAIGRHKTRPALPNDFTDHVVKNLQTRIRKRHNASSELGRGTDAQQMAALESHALRALGEIRIKAEPNWSEPRLLKFLLIRKTGSDGISETDWEKVRAEWEGLLTPHGVFTVFKVLPPILLAELSAAEYISTDKLDLDHLSGDG